MEFHPSVAQTIDILNDRCGGAKLLALGQTVFWDEPMKAVVRTMLDRLGSDFMMVAGIHDTDYFAKLKLAEQPTSPYLLIPHNDGSTRGLWSAAGEISQLFGNETVVTRERYQQAGVPFDKVARYYPGGRNALREEMSAAWGWRGLVGTDETSIVPHNLPLSEVAGPLLELLQWGFEGTYDLISGPNAVEEARAVGDKIITTVCDLVEQNPQWSLSDLYQHLIVDLYGNLLGYRPQRLEVDCSAHLLRLNTKTSSLPRFRLLDAFLRPDTREACEKAYNGAVADSEIYTLDRFGPGAIPFDVVLAEHGRGTLRVIEDQLIILTPKPQFIPLQTPIRSVHDLAARLEQFFGDHATVTGKAVSLVSMLAAEFVFVFNEEGSSYVWRTRKMNQAMREAGVDIACHPILRVRYHTWDAFGEIQTWLRLPDHLADAFGQRDICAPSFAQRWKAVVESQRAMLANLSKATRVRDLIHALQEVVGGHWNALAQEYDRLEAIFRQGEQQRASEQARISELFDTIRQRRREMVEIEHAKGDHYRAHLRPLQEQLAIALSVPAPDRTGIEARIDQLQQERRERYDTPILRARETAASARREIEAIRRQRATRERAPEALRAHELRRNIEREAQLARMRIVRNAILTVDGLEHTQHRPTAWWLPMLCPTGCWFEKIAESAELYLEELA